MLRSRPSRKRVRSFDRMIKSCFVPAQLRPFSDETVRRCVPNVTTCANPRPSGEKPGPMRRSSRPATTTRDPNTMSSRCSLILPDASTWATSATTRWGTSWPAIDARAVSMFSTRWVGTRSACRPKTRPCRTTRIRRFGPTPTSTRCARNCSRWACRSTGRAKSRPATPATTSTSRSCFSISSPPDSWRARSRRLTGIRSITPSSPTSR